MIRGQLQGRKLRQVLSPVGELGGECTCGKTLLLPLRKVCVLDRQFRECRRLPGGIGRIEGGQFLEEHPQRPSIRDDVMHDQQQDVLLLL